MIVVVAALFIASMAAMTFNASAAPDKRNAAADAGKVPICHYDEDMGTFKLITVSGNAVEKHIANHGDGKPGDQVPNIVQAIFGGNCEIISTLPTTPEITNQTAGQYFNSTPILNSWTASTDTDGIKTYQVAYSYDDGHTFGGSTCTETVIDGLPVSGCRDTTLLQRNHTPGLSEQGGVTIWVRAIDTADNASAWSDPVHYYYDATAPSVPVLVSPANHSVLNTNVFSFTWDASIDASPVKYEFQASLSSSQSDGVLNSGVWNNILNGNASQNNLTTPEIPSVGAPDGTWYWQVRAIDAAGNVSAWSEIWDVTLDT